ncbi:MAG: TolC family protein, partial [Planctomycetota bacterium]|nr:TolC family protein [Planctomycetota bacterium]
NAFRNRPEYQAARLDLDSRNLALVVARNARYPKLDLQGTFALNGLTGSYGNTVDSLVSTDFYEWNVGLTLELPRGFRSARSTYRRRQNEKAQTLLRMKQLEQQILREVRLSTRQVRATQKRIQTTEAARDLQREKLAGEEDRLKDGQSTPQEVLDFQVDFAVAELNHERSKLDYQKAIVDLEVAQGTLLETRLIETVDNQILGSE